MDCDEALERILLRHYKGLKNRNNIRSHLCRILKKSIKTFDETCETEIFGKHFKIKCPLTTTRRDVWMFYFGRGESVIKDPGAATECKCLVSVIHIKL